MAEREARIGVAAPAWKFAIPLALLAVALGFVGWWWSVAPGLLCLYVLYFFRDPGRQTPNIPGSVISPADGKVVSAMEVPCDRFPDGRAMRVAIFLNIFDVHIQRAPSAGSITEVVRKSGKFINAMNEKCSEENEQVTIWMENDDGVLGVRQIAGAIARRIVCRVKQGDALSRGERYGLIQFGSRVELFLPADVTVKVQPGQRVKGGETCVALLYEDDVRKGRALSRTSTEAPVAGVG